MSRINLSDFSGADDLARINAALAYMKDHPGTTLFIEPGTYYITTDLARETQKKVMAGELGANPEPVMFNPKFVYSRGLDFDGHAGSRVEAYGVTLMVDGFMEVVSIRNCRDIEVCGLTVDLVRKAYSKGIVTSWTKREDGNGDIEVEFVEKSPITKTMPTIRSVFYSPVKCRFEVQRGLRDFEYIDEHHARFVTGLGEECLGDELYLWHTFHSRPTVLIEEAQNTVLRDITIHNQCGMGITAQHATDILIERLNVIPSIGEHMSTNTDATHFASCRGKLTLDGCRFEGQGDDSINVHTYYYTLDSRDGDVLTLSVKAPTGTHAQSLDYPEVGDRLELTEKATLNQTDTFRVVEVEKDFDNWVCRVKLDRPIPDDMEGLFFADPDELPELIFRNCTARNHFARSILIKCRKALVENCEISDVAETAVKIAAEAGWHEGIGTSDVTVRGCRFINNGRWNQSCGGVAVYMDVADRSALTHDFVTVEDNIIECPEAEHGIIVTNTKKAVVRRNKIISRSEDIVIGDGVEVICE